MTSLHCCGTEQKKYSCTVLHECMSSHCRCLNEYVQGDCCRSAQCASWDPPPEFFLQNKVGYDVLHVGRPYAVIACRLSRVGDAAIVRSHTFGKSAFWRRTMGQEELRQGLSLM